jgi:hypothetical protein
MTKASGALTSKRGASCFGWKSKAVLVMSRRIVTSSDQCDHTLLSELRRAPPMDLKLFWTLLPRL